MKTVTINYQAFTDNWKIIGSFAKKNSVFPRSATAFEQRYGTFPDAAASAGFLGAITAIDGVLAKIGTIEQLKQLIAGNPDYLTRPNAPEADLYGKTIWLANQAANISGTVVKTFEGWKNLLAAQPGSSVERAQKLCSTLTGPSGLCDQLNNLSTLASAMAAFAEPEIEAYSKAFRVISGTHLLDDANETIGRLESENDIYASRISKIKAGENKLSALFSGNKNQKEIEDLSEKIAANEKEVARKTQFTDDLVTPFFVTGNKLTVCLKEIQNNLSAIAGDFSELSNRLAGICKISSEEQLGDYQWVAKAFDLDSAIPAWQQLQTLSTNYAVNAFVS